jgi:hypothetical protein
MPNDPITGEPVTNFQDAVALARRLAEMKEAGILRTPAQQNVIKVGRVVAPELTSYMVDPPPSDVARLSRMGGRVGPGGEIIPGSSGMIPNFAEDPRSGAAALDALLVATNFIPGGVGAKAGVMAALPVIGKTGMLGGKRAAITATNLRALPLADAIKVARTQSHIIPSPSREAYVGAPSWIKTPEDLQKMRDALDARITGGAAGADWYQRAQGGIMETAGANPAMQSRTAGELAVTSEQAGINPNLGFSLTGRNFFEAGLPIPPIKTGSQARRFQQGSELGFRFGRKTGPYQQNLDPTTFNPTTGANDIWHGRNLGYSEDELKGGLTAQNHAFMDAETVLAVDRANQRKLGGRTDWTAGEIQAAPWVEARKRSFMERYNWPEDKALAEALKSYPDYFQKYTAFGTHEATPGVATGHLPELATGNYAERAAYAADPRSSWRGPGGRDVIYGDVLRMQTRPSQPATGVFEGAGGLEINPADVARPMVSFAPKGGDVAVDVPSRAMMNAAEAARSYIDAQAAGAWHIPMTHGKPGGQTSLFSPRTGPTDPAEILRLKQFSAQHGYPDIVDTGSGMTFTRFPYEGGPPPLTVKERKAFERHLTKEAGGVPAAVRVESGYIPMHVAAPGTGEATRALRGFLQTPDAPKLMAKFDASPELKQAALARLDRDAELAAKTGQPVREDIQNARRILSKENFSALFKALDEGKIALPVGLAAYLGSQAQGLRGQGE